MIRVAFYRRVSQETATNVAGSMQDQLTACTAALRDGWTLIEDYQEVGKSAYNERGLHKRPEYQRMLADAKAGRFDLVLVYKFDRFSRRTVTALQARAELEQAGVDVVSATEPFDTRTAAGRFGVRQMLSVAELFSDMLGERIGTRRRAEAASGRHVGRIPAGYQTGDKAGDLIVHPPYDAMVVAALELYAPGQHSPRQIAAHLGAMGYTMPNGNPIARQDVRRLAQNAPIYAGYVRSNGLWIVATQHPPIISEALCARVLETFERRSKAMDRRFVRTQEPTALLAGLLYCESCRLTGDESKMHYMIDRRKDPPYRRFRCKRSGDTANCATPYSLAAPIEAEVLALVDAFALPDDWMEEAAAIAADALQAKPPPGPDPERIQEQIRRLGRRYSDLVISEAEYQSELARLRAQLSAQPLPRPTPRVTVADVLQHLRNLPQLIHAGTVGEQRAALGEVFDQVYVMRDSIAAIRPTALYESLIHAAQGSVRGGGSESTRHARSSDAPAAPWLRYQGSGQCSECDLSAGSNATCVAVRCDVRRKQLACRPPSARRAALAAAVDKARLCPTV